MSSKTTPTTQNGVLLALASLALAALAAIGIGAQTPGSNGADREANFHSLREQENARNYNVLWSWGMNRDSRFDA